MEKKIIFNQGSMVDPAHLIVEIRCHCGTAIGGLFFDTKQPWLRVLGWRRGSRRDINLVSLLDDNPEDVYLLKCRKHKDEAWRPGRDQLVDLHDKVRSSGRKGVALIGQGRVLALRYK